MTIKNPNDIKIRTAEVVDADFNSIEGIDLYAEDVKAPVPAAIPEAQKLRAFQMYMGNNLVKDIAATTGIKKGTLLSWIARESWAEQRTEANALSAKDALETKKVLLNDITVEMLQGITATIKAARDEKGAFKVKELPVFLAAVGNLEKLSRLAQGLPTSISEERSKRAQFTIPMEAVKNASQLKIADPFAEKEHPEATDTDENTPGNS